MLSASKGLTRDSQCLLSLSLYYFRTFSLPTVRFLSVPFCIHTRWCVSIHVNYLHRSLFFSVSSNFFLFFHLANFQLPGIIPSLLSTRSYSVISLAIHYPELSHAFPRPFGISRRGSHDCAWVFPRESFPAFCIARRPRSRKFSTMDDVANPSQEPIPPQEL